MSSRGKTRAQIEKEAQERIRREQERRRQEQVRKEIREMLAEIERQEFSLASSGQAARVQKELEEVLQKVEGVKESIERDVDANHSQARSTLVIMRSLQNLSEQRLKDRQQALDALRLTIVEQKERAEQIAGRASLNEHMSQAQNVSSQLEKLLQAFDRGERGGLETGIEKSRIALNQLERTIEESKVIEAERRYIVKALSKSMIEQGFIVGKPHIVREGNRVVLKGEMPSGRLALFRVELDGAMEFDLDGYEGRSCAVDLDRVLQNMEDRFAIHSEPPQHDWKNPDRITKGAKGFPTGGQTRSMGGGG